MTQTNSPYLKSRNCTDAADCLAGIEICNSIIKQLIDAGKSPLAYQRVYGRLCSKLAKFQAKS